VSLFSELFNEMLMRDFGMLVYRSVSSESSRKDRRDKKEDEDSDKKKKKDKKSSFSPLLLAYCYFDLSHCNYIASKDLEDLFLTLGLQLSRAQVFLSHFLQPMVFNLYCLFICGGREIIGAQIITEGCHRRLAPLQKIG